MSAGANGRQRMMGGEKFIYYIIKKVFPSRAIIPQKIFISFNEFLIGFLLKGIISRNVIFFLDDVLLWLWRAIFLYFFF
jgi:hypothetical protein